MKKKSISIQLFRSYVVFFSIFISALLIIFGLYVGVDINQKIVQTREQMLRSMNQNINNFFEDMNDFSMTLVNSRHFKRTVINDFPKAYASGDRSSTYFKDLFHIAYKMIEKDYKIGVYTNDGYYIWMGNNYFINYSKFRSLPLYENYYKNGYMNIKHIRHNPFLEEYLDMYPNYGIANDETISLARTFNQNNVFNKPEAMLEIHVPYQKLTDLMETISTSHTMNTEIWLYNKNGEVLYSEVAFPIQDYMKDGVVIEGAYRHQGSLINIMPVESTDLFMVSAIPYGKLYESLNKYIVIAIAAFFFVNVVLIMITYKIAIHISTPIQNICRQVKNMDIKLNSTKTYTRTHTDIHEINILDSTIGQMQEKINNSLEEIVRLQSFEIQSKMLALQSQMQPHFLYNTLMTISALSDEGANHKVTRVCQSLTHMLRYISSSDSHQQITIADEMEYVDKYVHIMEERFEDTTIEYNVSLDMLDLIVPKLIIQPLVENSFKYSESESCHISIDGYMDNERWMIGVVDNGPGFLEEDIKRIMTRCEKIWENYRTQSLDIDGMGLPNIYIRLKLLYGEDMYFNITNDEDGGGIVEIGGSIKRV